MRLTPVVPGVYEVALGQVNAHLIDTDNGLLLIDTGYPGSAPAILRAVVQLGYQPSDLKRIVVTHCHEDHAGSLAELQRLTGATCAMHPLDAAMTRRGASLRPLVRGPGLLNGLVYRLLIRKAKSSIEPGEVHTELEDGHVLPDTDGLRAIHAPGHSAGQIALIWPCYGGVLFAADSCASVFGLAMSPAYEDLALGRQTLARLAREEFNVAVFGHGRPYWSRASARFQKRWAAV